MVIMKEISADQVLSLLFISLGSESVVCFRDIDRFFDILKEVRDNNGKNNEYGFGINMPMKGNFNETLFSEISEGENIGKLQLVKASTNKSKEITKEKLTKYFISLVGTDRIFINDCKVAMKLFSEEYNRYRLCEQKMQGFNKETLLEKVKGLVKYKKNML